MCTVATGLSGVAKLRLAHPHGQRTGATSSSWLIMKFGCGGADGAVLMDRKSGGE
jgi:hypothetical protein